MQYGISHEDIYNFDETGFAMGLIATTKVVTRANMPGKPHLIQPGNREWTTFCPPLQSCLGRTISLFRTRFSIVLPHSRLFQVRLLVKVSLHAVSDLCLA
jgi:hypothetical protein